ncbi:hypothetical protein [Aeromonas sp. QDB25]|uniref:hypothetical protein n=1 Tax=Aeromonas sp. QDB25 TaxID=2989832 RepID=UPI0022DEAD84|nr:hypothetical protein [Aeromonas sp. QDB25]
MTEIAFNAELLIFQFVVVDDEYGQSLIIIGEKNVSIHRNSIDTGKMRRSSLDPTFLLA